MKKLLIFILAFLATSAHAIPSDHGVDYDIVYVAYPMGIPDENATPDQTRRAEFSILPQGEEPYRIMGGADLMLLKPNGTKETLVDCNSDCSVMDPRLSYDGTTIYYSKIVGIDSASDPDGFARDTAGYIYKIVLTGGAPYTEVQLTYPGTFDSLKYAGNVAADDMSTLTPIRDMAPLPLSNGKLMFTSNRMALMSFNQQASPLAGVVVQQLYTMDDHDGTANTPELSNMKRISQSEMHMVQHPIQLRDGRIIFTTWQDFAHKFRYAMSELFTMYPDGSNLQQFTEPHDNRKNLNHFITQLSNDDVIVDWYYPSFDYGFGTLVRYDPTEGNGTYTKAPFTQADPDGANYSFRKFDRGTVEVITSHTIPYDQPAPNGTGKYAMPAWAPNNEMLVAYSKGYVNFFGQACQSNLPVNEGIDKCEELKSGIYLYKNATTSRVTDPTNTAQLAPMIDEVGVNEIWPVAVVPYNDIFGQSAPNVIPSVRETENNVRIGKGESAAIVGTSSMLNRESAIEEPGVDPDGIFEASYARGEKRVGWTIQGTEVGLFSDSDVYGFRILAIPEMPHTSMISGSVAGIYRASVFEDTSFSQIGGQGQPHRYASTHNETWEILGEFPLPHTGTTDNQGNPDTSWMAKIPAEINTTIQAIDINGMTLYSESVWRSMAPGEERTDCGGCHAHSTEVTPLPFNTTQAGQDAPITGILNVADTDSRIQYGIVDMTTGTVPLLDENGGVEWVAGKTVDIEFERDIQPILTANCVACHTAGQSNGGLILDTGDPWVTLARTSGYKIPQVSKYIRSPQARSSLLAWVAWDQRLDGRSNSDRADDIDYPAHPVLNLAFEDKRTIARWIDLGAPRDMPDSVSTDPFKYTDDNQLPHIEIYSPSAGSSPINQKLRFGVMDAQSSINWATLAITWYDVATPGTVNNVTIYDRDDKGVVNVTLPALTVGNDYVFKIAVDDAVGNSQEAAVRFTAAAAAVTPNQVTNIGVSVQ